MQLIPSALRTLYERCIPAEKLEEMLSDFGFAFEGRFVPMDGVLQGAAYFEAEGTLKRAWRNAESSWALAPEVEIAAAEEKLRELRENSDLNAYLAKYDHKRRHVG